MSSNTNMERLTQLLRLITEMSREANELIAKEAELQGKTRAEIQAIGSSRLDENDRKLAEDMLRLNPPQE